MGTGFHAAVLATSLVATAAVGFASAAIIRDLNTAPAVKADRLPVVADESGYFTIETRTDGVSVLERVPIG